MQYQLRPYQESAVQSAINWVKYMPDKNGIVWAATAAGKSIMIARIAEAFPEKRVLVLAHRKELLEQNVSKIAQSEDTSIYSAGLGEKNLDGRIVFAGIQSIARAKDLPDFDLILVDECFTGDTLVLTLEGEKRIDTLSKGDIVFNACGLGAICDIYKRQANNLLEVKFSNGTTIRCTPEHPFFTDRGWEKAKDLVEKREAYSIESLSALWEGVYSCTNSDKKRLEKEEVLLNILCEESREPDELQCNSHENERYFEENKAPTNKTRGQREVIANTAISTFTRFRGGLASGGCDKDKCGALQRSLPERLQGGHCQCGKDDCNRVRRTKPLREEERTRFEKGRFTESVRVESVSHFQRESSELVYNLHVSGHPSYFANGVLVHNCHRVSNDPEGEAQYWQLIKRLGTQRGSPPQILGFTATPFRLGGGFLSWGEIIYEIKYPALLELGFVTKLSNKVTGTPDLSRVKVKLGEYVESQLEATMIEPELLEAAVEAVQLYSTGRESVLIFAVSKKHCELLCEAMKASEIAGGVAYLTGDTSDSERAAMLENFKAGNLRFLINCMILIEGFDAPCVDAIFCLRPTMSKALWEQMLGRGVRLYNGKENCLIIDMAGNLVKHGSLAAPYHEKPKAEAADSEAGKICPECETFNEGKKIVECEECGYVFPMEEPEPRTISHNYEPDMESDAVYKPTRRYEVRSVSYRKHVKGATGAESLRIDYVCDGAPYGSFSEWLSVKHENDWVRDKAWKLFKERGVTLNKADIRDYTFPELLKICDEELAEPYAIVVDTSGKFPTIVEYEFDSESWEEPINLYKKIEEEVYELDSIPF